MYDLLLIVFSQTKAQFHMISLVNSFKCLDNELKNNFTQIFPEDRDKGNINQLFL